VLVILTFHAVLQSRNYCLVIPELLRVCATKGHDLRQHAFVWLRLYKVPGNNLST